MRLMIPRYRPTLDTARLGRALLGAALVPSANQPLLPLQELILQPSASHALLHSLLGLRLTGAVVIPAYTCERVVAAVCAAGCQPTFVDIDPRSGTIDINMLQQALAMRPQAVLATHIFGIPCDIEKIVDAARAQGVLVIEDCALASGTVIAGRRAGDWGDIALFSFGFGKTVNLGYGGALKINNARLKPDLDIYFRDASSAASALNTAAKLALGSHLLWRGKYLLAETIKSLLSRGSRMQDHPKISRITPAILSAAGQKSISRVISALDQEGMYSHQRLLGEIYTANIAVGAPLKPLANPQVNYEPLYPSFPLRVSARASLHAHLRKVGFDCSLFFSYSAADIYGDLDCPHSRELGQEVLCLPVHAGVSPETACAITASVNQWSDQQSPR